jgi:hypothetical protein
MMIALHQKRGKFKFVSIVFYINMMALGSTMLST